MINYPDYMLYNHFNETFWRKIEHVGFEKVKLMASEIKKLSKQLETECVDHYDGILLWKEAIQ